MALSNRLKLAVVLLALVALAAAACSSDDAESPGGEWAAEGLTLRYPSGFAADSIDLANAESASGCICGAVMTRTLEMRELASATFRYRDDNQAGIRVAIIDASAHVLAPGTTGQAPPGDTEVRAIATELGLPAQMATEQPPAILRPEVAGLPAVQFELNGIERLDHDPVGQSSWLVLDQRTGRIYQITCQYSSANANAVRGACQGMVEALTVAT
jgi:hypothetical protein